VTEENSEIVLEEENCVTHKLRGSVFFKW